MKKLSILFAILIFCSCSQRTKITVIETFDKEITSSIHPKEKGTYSTYRVEIQGEVNDSIKIIYFEGAYTHYFSGKINESMRIDYYGGISEKLTFKPYKATKGKLTITQKLL